MVKYEHTTQQLNTENTYRCIFLSFGKNIGSVFVYLYVFPKSCVVAIGAVYFSAQLRLCFFAFTEGLK